MDSCCAPSFLSSTNSRYSFSCKSPVPLASLPLNTFSQTLTFPNSSIGLGAFFPARVFGPRTSCLGGSKRNVSAKASQLPLVGDPVPDFDAEAVFNQELIEGFAQICLPQKPPKNPKILSMSTFHEKILFLESVGLDPFSLIRAHPPIATCPTSDLRASVHFLHSLPLSPTDLQRVLSMCPDILAIPASSLLTVVTFLRQEVGLDDPRLLHNALHRRPRLLASSVPSCLRPTLYFLRSLGIVDIRPHAALLSCSVEAKLLPRLHYLQHIGFSCPDSVSMLRRFPALFCYSIEENFEPKFQYLVFEMGRELKELKEFPQYFSFSLEKRIKPRHQACIEKGVSLPLALMLKVNDTKFYQRLEVFHSSTPPLRSSLLYSASLDRSRFNSNSN